MYLVKKKITQRYFDNFAKKISKRNYTPSIYKWKIKGLIAILFHPSRGEFFLCHDFLR